MAIEFIPRPEIKKPSPEENFLFYLAIIFLIASLISLLVLKIGVRNSNKALAALATQISARAAEGKVAEVTAWREKMKDYNFIFNLHQIPSNVFIFSEEIIHPKIWLNSFKLNSETQTLEIKGIAQNFLALAEQILVLENHKLIEKIALTEISLRKEGDIEFQMQLFFKGEIFKPKL